MQRGGVRVDSNDGVGPEVAREIVRWGCLSAILIMAHAMLATIAIVNLGVSDLGQTAMGLVAVWSLAVALLGIVLTAAVIATLNRWLSP